MWLGTAKARSGTRGGYTAKSDAKNTLSRR